MSALLKACIKYAVKQKREMAISSGPLPRFEPELPTAALACWEQEAQYLLF